MKAHQTAAAPDQNDAIVKLFNDFDVKETSYHLVISHLDLHICDDIHSKEKGNFFFLSCMSINHNHLQGRHFEEYNNEKIIIQ